MELLIGRVLEGANSSWYSVYVRQDNATPSTKSMGEKRKLFLVLSLQGVIRLDRNYNWRKGPRLE